MLLSPMYNRNPVCCGRSGKRICKYYLSFRAINLSKLKRHYPLLDCPAQYCYSSSSLWLGDTLHMFNVLLLLVYLNGVLPAPLPFKEEKVVIKDEDFRA